MTQRLTAIEFVATQDGLQLLRVKRKEQVILEFMFEDWIGCFLAGVDVLFDDVADLKFECTCVGVNRSYWNDELPPFVGGVDQATETARVAKIRRAAIELAKKGSVLAMGVPS